MLNWHDTRRQKMQQHMPRVSIVTPTTYSRSNFAPLLVRNVLCQTYPKHLLELIVVGDTDPRTEQLYLDVFEQLSNVECRYYSCQITGNIGKKRNFACERTRTKYVANMDDDDLYQKSYLEHAVTTLKEKKVNIVACRDMIVFFPLAGGKITMVRGSTGHEATFVCRKQHWKNHKYAPTATGEGASMIDGTYYNELDIRKVMICFSHGNNTYDKSKLQQAPSVTVPDVLRRNLLDIWSACSTATA